MSDDLNEKQRRFIAEYLVDLNGTQAAIRAGYSENGADVTAVRLLGNPSVAEAVQKGQERKLARAEVTADRVIQELARLGFSDLRAVFTEDGKLRPIQELDDDAAKMIASVKVTKETTHKHGETMTQERVTEVKLWDKVAALGMLAKHLGLLKDRVEHTGKDGAPIEHAVKFYLPTNGRRLTD